MQQFTKPPRFPISFNEIPALELFNEIPARELLGLGDGIKEQKNKTYRDWVIEVLTDLGEATVKTIYTTAIDRGMKTNGTESTAMRKIRNALHVVASYRNDTTKSNNYVVWKLNNQHTTHPVVIEPKTEPKHNIDVFTDKTLFTKCLISVIETQINMNDLPSEFNIDELRSDLLSYKMGSQLADVKLNEQMFNDGLKGNIPTKWSPFIELSKQVIEQFKTIPEMHRVICKIMQ